MFLKNHLIVNQLVNEAIKHGGKIRTSRYVGSGRHTRVDDRTTDVAKYLTKLGIEHVCSNDAPRGGQVGNYIYVYINY